MVSELRSTLDILLRLSGLKMNLVEIQKLFFRLNSLGHILASVILSFSLVARMVGIQLIY